MKYLKKIKSVFSFQSSVVSIVLIGAFLRFYNLGWGLPYPFHPDERNMADAIVRFSTGNLDPKFYAYGQFPLYLAYFTGRFFFSLWERENLDQLNFTQAILALRFWSAFFSTATIFVVYLISKRIFGKNSSKPPISQYPNILISPLLVAFTPGLIQAAHFGTTESVLTFCFLTIIYFSLKILEKPNLKNFFWAAFFLGLALGSKISAAVFATPIALAVLWQLKERKTIKEKFKIVLLSLFTLTFTLTLTLLSFRTDGSISMKR